ncbi:MAG: class II glutamine amidotransferase [Candidatus Heimdallarchaeota archaeon]|nr:class II glutamine amidotransferase [Candidatus Heimdallarchaeota archaeon]MCK5049032.1 class II glutamine amidotransferase [Candidatus Heimdallarchaeota archaeon]
MCHLAGIISTNHFQLKEILEPLSLQEAYIGAQATGITFQTDNELKVIKQPGPVKEFLSNFEKELQVETTWSIVHSRYSLAIKIEPGKNRSENAHPFLREEKDFVMAHNGIISWEKQFKELRKNHTFQSLGSLNGEEYITDSEVFLHVLAEKRKDISDTAEAIREACKEIEGMYAFFIFDKETDGIWIANNGQPLFLGVNAEKAAFSSFLWGFDAPIFEGLHPFPAPRNALIFMKPGKINIETLIENKWLPTGEPDINIIADKIISLLKEEGKGLEHIDFYLKPNNHHWSEAWGVSEKEYSEKYLKVGLSYTSFIFQAVQKLLEKGLIEANVNLVKEAGCDDVPRMVFTLK